MNKNRLEKILYFLGLGGLVSCLLSPLMVSGSTYFPFVVGKALTFQIAVEFILIIYLLLNLISDKYRPKFNILHWLILGYFFIVTISSIFGVDFNFSFWSNYERMDGLFNLYHFGVYVFLLTAFLNKRKDWLMFFRFLLGTLILIDVLGFFQKEGIGYLAKFSSDRAFSTLGNATYLGFQAVFQIAIASFLFFADRKFWWKVFYIINGFLGIMAIFISQTRGALLSITIGGTLFLILASLFSKRRKMFISLFGVITLLAGMFVFILSHPDWKISQMIPARFNVFSGNFSLETRGVVWKVALKAWQDKPMLGWGRSSFGFVFAPFYNPEAASFEDVWFDKPHNKILEVGTSSGILGLSVYLSIFGAVIYTLWKKRNILGDGSYILIALCGAYIVDGFFLFDFQASYLWWYSIVGFASFLLMDTKRKRKNKITPEQRYVISFILIIISVTAFVVGNIKPLMAAKRGVRALNMEYQGASFKMVSPIYKSALELGTFGNGEIITETTKPLNRLKSKLGVDHIKPFLTFAVEEENKIYQQHPNDLKNALYLASIYRMRSRFYPEDINKAQKIYQEVLKKAPNNIGANIQLAVVEFARKDFDSMIQHLDRAINLNRNYYKSYFEAGQIYFIGGRKKEGRELIAKAINAPKFPWHILISANFLQKDDIEWLKSIYQRVGQIEPEWVYPDLIMAGLYGSLKDSNSMLKYLKKAILKQPNLEFKINKILGIKLNQLSTSTDKK